MENLGYNDTNHEQDEEMTEVSLNHKSVKGQSENLDEVIETSCDEICNQSGNTPFEQILQARVSRRAMVAGGLSLAALTIYQGANPAEAGGWFKKWKRKPLINFKPVSIAQAVAAEGKLPVISDDYEYQVLIPWGEPLQPGGPLYEGDPNSRPTADQQKEMIGLGHDGMWFFPKNYNHKKYGSLHTHFRRCKKHCEEGMLAINHEFARNTHVLGKSAPESLEDVRLSQHAHGVAVVAIKKIDGKWQQVKSKNARRIHVNTEVEFSGPVAGHPLLKNAVGNQFQGTVNNCANGYTPWGTYLTCEENFNGYFGATGDWTPTAEDERYGFSTSGFGYGWENFDERFDMSNNAYENERNRFGWVVEIDPMNGKKKPVKRTALGRLKHEGVAVTEGRGGRVVCYMGDDQRFDYIYKFVSADNWKRMIRKGKSPLDEGKLYVAKFNDDGTGEWIELTIKNPVLAARFNHQAELLTYARIAADLVGATPMDRPEWATVAPNGDVYCTLTNNSQRTETNAANPEAPNNDGHIIKWRDNRRHTGTKFKWDLFIIASSTRDTEDVFTDPDGLWADPDGRLFIQTDGGQPDGLQDQMLVADTKTGELRRLFMGVSSDEITGITVTPDRRTMFINMQHPGNGSPTSTNFPAPFDGTTIPRDCTIVITKKDGGIIGS